MLRLELRRDSKRQIAILSKCQTYLGKVVERLQSKKMEFILESLKRCSRNKMKAGKNIGKQQETHFP